MGGVARGTAKTLELPAYRNDILEALSLTGGLPGLNAKNEVVILRKAYSDEFSNKDYMNGTEAGYAMSEVARRYNESGQINNLNSDLGVLRIPLRVAPGETPPQLTWKTLPCTMAMWSTFNLVKRKCSRAGCSERRVSDSQTTLT